MYLGERSSFSPRRSSGRSLQAVMRPVLHAEKKWERPTFDCLHDVYRELTARNVLFVLRDGLQVRHHLEVRQRPSMPSLVPRLVMLSSEMVGLQYAANIALFDFVS